MAALEFNQMRLYRHTAPPDGCRDRFGIHEFVTKSRRVEYDLPIRFTTYAEFGQSLVQLRIRTTFDLRVGLDIWHSFSVGTPVIRKRP
jgi:hypothetical protein